MSQQHWVVESACLPEWPDWLVRCGGGFFHSPAGLWAGAPSGIPVLARLVDREAVCGLAVGVRTRCRLSLRPAHVYFPTLPAIADSTPPETALEGLVRLLARQGVAEVVLDSFDARWRPDSPAAAACVEARHEYLVTLKPDPEALARNCSETHRRHVRLGQREGWIFTSPVWTAGVAALEQVQTAAAHRAERRGPGFAVHRLHEAARPVTAEPGSPWGMRVLAAYRGETLLAAALIGWANRRAVYVAGGSTSEGYACGAAVWLHWRIMSQLAEQGCTMYNLGGTPASAVQPGAPAHGLHRFKLGFGAQIVPCHGVRRTLRPAHLATHRWARLLSWPVTHFLGKA